MRFLLFVLIFPGIAVADFTCTEILGQLRCRDNRVQDPFAEQEAEKKYREERAHRELEAQYYRQQLEPKAEPLSDDFVHFIAKMQGEKFKSAKTPEEKRRVVEETGKILGVSR